MKMTSTEIHQVQFKGNSPKKTPLLHKKIHSSSKGRCYSCGRSHMCSACHFHDAICHHCKHKAHFGCVCCQKFKLPGKKSNKNGTPLTATNTASDTNGISVCGMLTDFYTTGFFNSVCTKQELHHSDAPR